MVRSLIFVWEWGMDGREGQMLVCESGRVRKHEGTSRPLELSIDWA